MLTLFFFFFFIFFHLETLQTGGWLIPVYGSHLHHPSPSGSIDSFPSQATLSGSRSQKLFQKTDPEENNGVTGGLWWWWWCCWWVSGWGVVVVVGGVFIPVHPTELRLFSAGLRMSPVTENVTISKYLARCSVVDVEKALRESGEDPRKALNIFILASKELLLLSLIKQDGFKSKKWSNLSRNFAQKRKSSVF